MNAWLHIVGIGEDGIQGLSPVTRAVVEAAEVIVGSLRHQDLISVNAERIVWPSPFDALIEILKSNSGKRVVVLATGDPLWYSVGARIGREIDPSEITYHPQVGAFQLAAARMGWSMADLETLTVHGRPVEQMIAFIQPSQRLLILTTGAETPAQIAGFLTERGFGQSEMTVLAAMGGNREMNLHDDNAALAAYRQNYESKTNIGAADEFRSVINAARILTRQGKFNSALATLKLVNIEKMCGYWYSEILLTLGETLSTAGRILEAQSVFTKVLAEPTSSQIQQQSAQKALADLFWLLK